MSRNRWKNSYMLAERETPEIPAAKEAYRHCETSKQELLIMKCCQCNPFFLLIENKLFIPIIWTEKSKHHQVDSN